MEIYIPEVLIAITVVAIFFIVWQRKKKLRDQRQSTTLSEIVEEKSEVVSPASEAPVEQPATETVRVTPEDVPVKQPKSRNKGKRRPK